MMKDWKISSWNQKQENDALGTSTQLVPDGLAGAIRQEDEIRHIQIWKEEVKLSLFVDGMISYRENPKEYFKKTLELIREFSKVAGHKSNIQNWLYFYIISINETKMILEKIQFTITWKKIRIGCESGNKPHICGQLIFEKGAKTIQ